VRFNTASTLGHGGNISGELFAANDWGYTPPKTNGSEKHSFETGKSFEANLHFRVQNVSFGL